MSIIVRSNDATADAQVNEPVAKADAPVQTTPSAPVAEATEQKESSESETEETEGKEESETEGEESEEETEPKDGTEKPRRKGGFQRRVDKLTAAKAQAQAEAEYWKREALKHATDSKTEAKAEPAKESAASGKPKADDFDTHSEFVEALTDWKVSEARKADKEEAKKSQLQTEHQKQVASYVERRTAFQAKTPDFDEVMEGAEGVRLSPAVESLLLESDNGPELAYELAKNTDELARICRLAPLAAAREIGKIESRLKPEPSEAKKDSTKQITKAPKPLEPLKAGGKGSVPKSITDPTLSQAEFERLRREQMKRRRG